MSARIHQSSLRMLQVVWLAALLFAGCIGPFQLGRNCNTCGDTTEPPSCESPASSDCEAKSCWHFHTWGRCRDAVCCVTDWPCCACRRVVSFCVPDDVVGPSPLQGPGRFHPVPTHPVFAPTPEPLAVPSDM